MLRDYRIAPFPLSEADYAALRAQPHDRIIPLYEGEIVAQAALLNTISSYRIHEGARRSTKSVRFMRSQ